ncbi:MAG: L-threonylcarbamoyladenylate synthase [Patescibacteria group bacterium]
MKIISLKTALDQTAIKTAVQVLNDGGVIAYPTETTYGLGCDPRNAKAVARIYKLKGRERKKPFLLVASSVAQVRRVAKLHAISYELQARYWPGPLTLVLPVKRMLVHRARLHKSITPHDEIAVRVSSSPFVRALCKAYGFPIVSTSANKTGESECRSRRAVRRVFGKVKTQTLVPDLIIDAGALPRRKPSTVVRIKANGTIEVLRQGAIKIHET